MSLPGFRHTIDRVTAYVGGRTIEEVKREYGLEQVIKLGSNENPYAPFPAALEAMREALLRINTYPEATFVELKAAIARYAAVAPSQVAIAHGAGGMLETLAKALIVDGDHVLVARQSYGLYREISLFMGAELQEVDLDAAYRVDVDAFVRALRPDTKLVWLCNPNNPTGTSVPAAEIKRLIAVLPERAWLVLDEAYAEFAPPSGRVDVPSLIQSGARVVVVRTFSKAFGLAGARVGYALAAEQVIHAIDTVAEPFNANRVGLAGARAVIEADGTAFNAALEAVIETRRVAEQRLRDLGCKPVESHANFLFFELPDGAPHAPTPLGAQHAAPGEQPAAPGAQSIAPGAQPAVPGAQPAVPGAQPAVPDTRPAAAGSPAAEVAARLLRRGVIVRDCAGWGYPRHLRVSVGTAAEMETFFAQFMEVLGNGSL